MAKAIEVEAAREEILARARPLPAESVALRDALGRRLARDAVADGPYQPFDNSAMDGFAVRSSDLSCASNGTPMTLTVVDESRAGHPAERALGPGEAIAISTGAVLPDGADAVVRVEDTGPDVVPGQAPPEDRSSSPEASDVAVRSVAIDIDRDPSAGSGTSESDSGRNPSLGRATEVTESAVRSVPIGVDDDPQLDRAPDADARSVSIRVAASPGANLRRAGEDIGAGETVLRAGAELGPAELGALATIGVDPVAVHRRPRVAVLTSGDELTPTGEALAPGGIRDSNSHTVAALARLAGAEIVSVAWTPDEPAASREALAVALDADVTIVCGGVSVGAHDHVKEALADLGAEQVFWRVALKPGGPTWFGTRGETLVFGLPGNPVSVMATFLLLVRPALLALAGGTPGARRTVARLGAAYEKPTDRAHAVRCRLELTPTGWVAWPLPRQGSHVLTSMLAADCLALVPTDSAGLAAGDTVEVELLDRASMGR